MLPYIFIFDRPIPMYGLCVVVGALLASWVAYRMCKREKLCIEDALVIGVTALGMGLVSAKILYIVITFSLAEVWEMVKSGRVELLLNGGFVYYGGLIGGILGALLGAAIMRTKVNLYEKTLITVIPLAHSLGRIGCFFAGCCYGRPTESVLSVIYKNPIGNTPVGVPLMPIQIYEATYNLGVFFLLYYLSKRIRKGFILPCYLILYAVGRFFLEFFRYDYVRGILFGLSTSQIISVGIIVAAGALFIKRKTGI